VKNPEYMARLELFR
jgi:hypothetical protein